VSHGFTPFAYIGHMINDLAKGDLTHTELGEKCRRHPQAIAQFAVRARARKEVRA
jgi:hypothetical protein